MNWDLKKFRAHIVNKYGGEQLKLLEPSLNSIAEKQHYCSYHYREAKCLQDAFLGGDNTSERMLTAILRSACEAEWSDRDKHYLNIRANLSACLLSLHSISDTISHVVYYALGMNLGESPLKERDISIAKVKAKLKKLPYEELLSLLEQLDDDYLAAITNYSKHRSIITPEFTVHMKEESKTHAFYFKGFTYEKEIYETRNAFEYLVQEVDRRSSVTLRIGAYFNERT